MDSIQALFIFLIFILLIWNVCLLYRIKKNKGKQVKEYYELNSKLNFITAFGSLAVLLFSYLGWDIKVEINENSKDAIRELIKLKSDEIDSLFADKNILKAGIYIVNDLEFKENKKFRFNDLLTFDNKPLPDFVHSPKLIISTSTGENLRIEKVTNEYFILGKPISKNNCIVLEEDNPKYPVIIKFDIWIADYKNKK